MHRSWTVPVLVCLIHIISSEAQSQSVFSPVAVTGVPANVTVPYEFGEPTMMTFDSLSNPIITDESEVAFGGSIVTPSGSESGVWQRSDIVGTLHEMAKENSPYNPTTFPGMLFGSGDGGSSFGPLKLSVGRNPTFRTRLKGTGVTEQNDSAVAGFAGLRFFFFREGDSVFPGLQAGDVFDVPSTVQETVLRRVPVIGGDASSDTAISAGQGPNAFIREGVPLSVGAALGDLADARPLRGTLSAQPVFRASFDGQTAVFRYPITVASETQFLDNPRDVQLGALNHPGLYYREAAPTDNNRVVFGAQITGPGVGPSNDTAIVGDVGDVGPWMILQEGTQAPGAAPGVVFGNLATDNIVGGGTGSFLFNAPLVGPGITENNDWALVAWSTASLPFTGQVFAQEGQQVSGLPAGSVLTGLDAPHFQFNLKGEAVFNAEFAGPGGSGHGLFFASMEQSEPTLLVRTGQEFDIGGGVFKTISDIGLMEMSNPWDGRASQFNDSGQVAFSLTFTDGSQGVFAGSVQAIPEPATIVLAVGAVIVCLAFRRHARAPRTGPR